MSFNPLKPSARIEETLRGTVDRVTFHNPDNGWSVLRVSPFDRPGPETVIVHQTRVFAGATMEFLGVWTIDPTYGRQFKAAAAIERKPASAAALEKYLGSGLIRGVGPKTARKIVRHFGDRTLAVFEGPIERLTEVPGIAERKLAAIRAAWREHRAVRDVMMFLQAHGISTLFAVRIFKEYGDEAIRIVSEDPYRLETDIFGIGFFSADRVALSLGFTRDSRQRIIAGVRHVLQASRELGHCYLTRDQIRDGVDDLLELDVEGRLDDLLAEMGREGLLKVRLRPSPEGGPVACYYATSLYFDEIAVARRIGALCRPLAVDRSRLGRWLEHHCDAQGIVLSPEQAAAVAGIAGQGVAVLTGGPGCGKTTTTRVVVTLLAAMGLQVALCAPTGRAAQRMTEVIGIEAKTIHRLLEWQGGRFKRGPDNPLAADALIVDECSMLDIGLTAGLLGAVPDGCRVVFIGDADQLPSVGAGNVLRDVIAAGAVPVFRLQKVFRQAAGSLIIRYAHQINSGELPPIDSPFRRPAIWRDGSDCLFFDSDEATQEQLRFVSRVKKHYAARDAAPPAGPPAQGDPYAFRIHEPLAPYETELTIPARFAHVDLEAVLRAPSRAAELAAVLRKIHPWSSLHYRLAASDVVRKLHREWIPKYWGAHTEIQVISPMTRGSLGTVRLNALLQAAANPSRPGRAELTVGERTFRVGDRVIHRRNNYELNVFNGDIGTIRAIDTGVPALTVGFSPDGREVTYPRDSLSELDLAYAITIHKSQGSEFEAVIVPVVAQHYKMLFRNLLYTALTRASRLAILVGTRKALAMAVRNQDTSRRQTFLTELIRSGCPADRAPR